MLESAQFFREQLSKISSLSPRRFFRVGLGGPAVAGIPIRIHPLFAATSGGALFHGRLLYVALEAWTAITLYQGRRHRVPRPAKAWLVKPPTWGTNG